MQRRGAPLSVGAINPFAAHKRWASAEATLNVEDIGGGRIASEIYQVDDVIGIDHSLRLNSAVGSPHPCRPSSGNIRESRERGRACQPSADE